MYSRPDADAGFRGKATYATVTTLKAPVKLGTRIKNRIKRVDVANVITIGGVVVSFAFWGSLTLLALICAADALAVGGLVGGVLFICYLACAGIFLGAMGGMIVNILDA